MNKRIRKKRRKLDDRHIGDHVYAVEYIRYINKMTVLFSIIKPMTIQNPQIKWTRANLKKALNYIIRRRRVDFSKMIPRNTFRYQKPPVLVEGDTSTAHRQISGGKTMKYKSSIFIQFTGGDDNNE